MTKMKTPADLLDRAAELMDARGKAVGKYEDKEGRVCALGAINYAFTGYAMPGFHQVEASLANSVFFPAAEFLHRYINQMLGHGSKSIVQISTASDNNLVDMPEAMRLAAKQWRQDNEI